MPNRRPRAANAKASKPARGAGSKTPLADYLARPDPSFAWRVVGAIDGPGHTGAVLELTSQTWLAADQVDRPVWTHWLTVIIPDEVVHDTAFLYITGGQHADPPPGEAPQGFGRLAVETRSIVAELRDVPNQPLAFADRPGEPLVEDALIAHQQVKFAHARDPEQLVRLPMVKSAAAAMTAIQQFLASEGGGGRTIRRFVVAGGSKRGWTTWLIGALDPRVRAIIPIVINVLDQEAVSRHHWGAMGYFSPAIKDYVEAGIIPDMIGHPGIKALRRIEDPLSYMALPAMTMPKFIINAVGDEFFPPDATRYSYGKLPALKRLRMLPNSRHSTAGTDILKSISAFYDAVLTEAPLPAYSWRVRADGAIVVRAEETPVEVNLWQGTNPDARDFRVDTIGEAFVATPMARQDDGTWVGAVEAPAKGFTAWFVELVFPSGGKYPFKFTTEVQVTPDVLPYAWKDARPITAPEGS
jgi:PhoPQ-activated pathogenicity-related protein